MLWVDEGLTLPRGGLWQSCLHIRQMSESLPRPYTVTGVGTQPSSFTAPWHCNLPSPRSVMRYTGATTQHGRTLFPLLSFPSGKETAQTSQLRLSRTHVHPLCCSSASLAIPNSPERTSHSNMHVPATSRCAVPELAPQGCTSREVWLLLCLSSSERREERKGLSTQAR